ncbi:hypothetical protein BGX23_001792 [Mortierella sp. AD031]|nr:hypothetical protein BGX23_001792 [Mortierella sp. AD031]
MRKAAERARQRREEEEAQREESKTRARAKADRLAQTAEETGIAKGLDELEIKEAEESDTKKVEESDAQENEDIGTETAEESEADAFDDTEAAAKEEAQKIEIVEEDQKIEAMEEDQKIEASKEGEGLEAKRRNEEPETGKEEPIALEGLNPRVGKPIREGVIGVGGFSTFYQLMSNAFKRLEADTTKANPSTEKEERDAKAKEERAASEAARAAQLEKVDQTLQQAKLPETVREFGNPRNRPHLVELTEEGRQAAMAKWGALGG